MVIHTFCTCLEGCKVELSFLDANLADATMSSVELAFLDANLADATMLMNIIPSFMRYAYIS